MKVYQLILICFGLSFSNASAQVSFTLPVNVCINASLALSASSGTLPNPQFTWLASPNAIFSNSVAPNTTLTFTAVGNHTVLLVAISGTAMAFTQNTINVIANPSPSLSASSASVCPNSTFSITASPLSGANYSFALPGPITVANGSSNVLQINPPTILPAIFEVSVELGGCVGTASVNVQQLQLNPQLVPTSNWVCLGYSATLTVFAGVAANYTFSVLSPSPASFPTGTNQTFIASPTVATVYQVLADYLGCTGTASISIGISPPLTINIIASSPTTCIMSNFPKISKSVTLSTTGGGTYTWDPPISPPSPWPFPGPIVVRPQQTTCYTVTGVTAVCSGTAAICITVTPQFTVAISPASASICLGETLTLLTASVGPGAIGLPSAFTYSWTEAMNAPPVSMSSYLTPTTSVFPQNSTTYSLEVTDTQTCVSLPQMATVEVFQCTAIEEQNRQVDFLSVFPNPATDRCELKSTGVGFSEVKVFDIAGHCVRTYSSPDGKNTAALEIDLYGLPPGVYFLRTNSICSEPGYFRLIKL